MQFKLFASIAAITALASTATGAALKPRALSGQATYYGGNVQGGACSFSTYTLPSNVFGTALSDSNWANSAECGGCVKVTGPNGKSITAMVRSSTSAPVAAPTTSTFPYRLLLPRRPLQGVIDITWDYVQCPITSPLQVHMKSGVSQYWFSAQIVNGNLRTNKLEVSIDQGKTWKSTTRQTYNFFEISSGTGASTA
ncbi:hypothetical protein H2203_006658 [Taxawa tesnikishii (nom. ined.)]|nr:hypothetical protein H2203_006658 [Dothideales sp. JES 119]